MIFLKIATNISSDDQSDDDKLLEYWWAELNRNEIVKVSDIYSRDDYLYFYDQGGPVLKSDQDS